MSEQREKTDDYDHHGGFPVYKAAEDGGGPDFGRLIEALRTVQDLAVSTAPPADVVKRAADQAEALAALLEPHRVPEGAQIGGRCMNLPGRGSLLMLPWTIEKFDDTGVRSTGVFRRFHLGGNGAAHGGTLPLVFDDLFGMITHAYGRPISRTAYLHVNYRSVTPINRKLVIEGQVDRVEGRKTFVSARMVDENGVLVADCEALMLVLLPGQP
ncbi:PaaI family thioesterase [Rhodococcus spelaei]|uniref:Acyl-coenzyme A thioesterase THEM4 n=1 Tax=Rhodococcus spelaei TaxID=2546320 RepID=A0A541B8M1_9NOCA|nr:PaaI family thioesterase [Rhodococcus spelaei]TQF68675.1 PaaI family thioesterase [Rhodococcus spelaei]